MSIQKGDDHIRTYYEDYAKHMWRYYMNNRYVETGLMTGTELSNWVACHTAMERLPQSGQDILQAWATCKRGGEEDAVRDYAKRNGLSRIDCWNTIRKAMRIAAVERGLIDDKGGGGTR